MNDSSHKRVSATAKVRADSPILVLSRPPTMPPPPPATPLSGNLPAPPPDRQLAAQLPERGLRQIAASNARGTASKRSATAKTSKEHNKEREAQRKAAKDMAETVRKAASTFKVHALTPAEVEEIERAKPQRPVPIAADLVFPTPHEAVPTFDVDWTRGGPSGKSVDQWEEELRLRDLRNRLLAEHLLMGRIVHYESSGNSMWPLVQSGDACTFHPVRAVTAADGMHAFPKAESKIEVGDIVFCIVQPRGAYYAHIVLRIETDDHAEENKYWIGNIHEYMNGFCYKEHIYGILVDVTVTYEGRMYSRPLPKTVFSYVQLLVSKDQWSTEAKLRCAPKW